MTKYRYLLYPAIIIPLFFVSCWLIVLPNSFIKATIENSISNHGNPKMEVFVRGLKKGIFLTVFANSIEVKNEGKVVLIITDIFSRINPLYLFKKQVAFSVRGKIGTGDIKGFFKLPESGALKIDQTEINAIPYIQSLGLKVSGLVSAQVNFKNNNIDVYFKTSPVDIQDTITEIPLPFHSFQKIQGVLHLQANTIKVPSISLEGEKGYARIKGDITDGFMNLILELMPSADKLQPIELMLIGKYQISPGYYVIPIEGQLL
jgi:type II secretion system protein N